MTDTPETNLNSLKKIFKEIVNGVSFIAFITFLGYLYTGIYQFFYLSYFGLDGSFIDLSIEKVLISCLGIVFLLMIFAPILPMMTKKYNDRIHRMRKLLLFLCLLFIIFLVLDYSRLAFYVILSIITSIILLNELILPLYYGRKVEGFSNKKKEYELSLRRSEINEKTLPTKSIDDFFKSFLDDHHILTIYLTSLLILAAIVLGGFTAKFRNQFYVLDTFPERVVVFRSDGNLITVNYNRAANEFEADYKVLSFEYLNEHDIAMKLEMLKPLKQPRWLRESRSGTYPPAHSSN